MPAQEALRSRGPHFAKDPWPRSHAFRSTHGQQAFALDLILHVGIMACNSCVENITFSPPRPPPPPPNPPPAGQNQDIVRRSSSAVGFRNFGLSFALVNNYTTSKARPSWNVVTQRCFLLLPWHFWRWKHPLSSLNSPKPKKVQAALSRGSVASWHDLQRGLRLQTQTPDRTQSTAPVQRNGVVANAMHSDKDQQEA